MTEVECWGAFLGLNMAAEEMESVVSRPSEGGIWFGI